MIITTEQLKELRDATGISVMQCKKALEEAEGNMEKALMILKKKSGDIAAKKADREVADGSIVIKKSGDKAAVVVLRCETDFVAKNDDFMEVANKIADEALASDALAAEASAGEMINSLIQKIGENVKLGSVEVVSGKTLGTYVHNGKAGVVVSLSGGNLSPEAGEALAKDVALHIAAMKPEYMKKEEIPAEKIALAKELFEKEVNESGKPEEIKAKMLQGKIDAYFKELTLLDQPFVKNPDITIGALVAKEGASVESFKRFVI